MKHQLTTVLIDIDHRRKDCLVEQIIDSIKVDIIQLHLQNGQILPTLDIIARENKVDESEILKAFEKLLEQGFLVLENNRYVVNRHRWKEDFSSGMKSVMVSIAEQGLNPRFKTIEVEIVNTLPALLRVRSKQIKDSYLHIRRLFYSNEIPVLVLDMFYDSKILPDYRKTNYDQFLIYEHLKGEFPDLVTRAERNIRALRVPLDISNLLLMPKKAPLLCFDYIGYAINGDELEYALGYTSSNYEIEQSLVIPL